MTLHVFADRNTCEQALVVHLAQRLADVLVASPHALLALAGGNTPQALYRRLASCVDTSKLVLTPTDERWVEPHGLHSNSYMLGQVLPDSQLISPPKTDDIEQDAAAWQQLLAPYPAFDMCLLGMGEDGHIASIFPDMQGAESALDLDCRPSVLVAQAPSEPRLRLTLNLTMLINTRWLGLLAFGEKKRELIEQASQGLAPTLPLHALLSQSQRCVDVFWAP